MLKIEWLDKYTPTGKRMLTVEKESLEFKDGSIADVFTASAGEDEWCVVEVYESWDGGRMSAIKWVGPSARAECEKYVAFMARD